MRRTNCVLRKSDAPDTAGQRHRGVLGLLKFLAVISFVCALVVGAVLVGPQAIAFVEDEALSPSSEAPPAADDRDPEHTHSGDPGGTTYETSTETITSSAVEDRIHELVIDERAERGIDSLEWDSTIASVSRAHSVDMYERDYFAHDSPDGEQPFDRFQSVADYCQAYGENIAQTWVDTTVERPSDGEHTEYQTTDELAAGIVEQWMHSDQHRAAILEEEVDGWDRGGVGVYIGDDGKVFATHNFCTEW